MNNCDRIKELGLCDTVQLPLCVCVCVYTFVVATETRRHGAMQGNDQINVTAANEAAPVPQRSASSALTSYRAPPPANERRNTHAHTHLNARKNTRRRQNTPMHDTDTDEEGLLLLVPDVSCSPEEPIP